MRVFHVPSGLMVSRSTAAKQNALEVAKQLIFMQQVAGAAHTMLRAQIHSVKKMDLHPIAGPAQIRSSSQIHRGKSSVPPKHANETMRVFHGPSVPEGSRSTAAKRVAREVAKQLIFMQQV